MVATDASLGLLRLPVLTLALLTVAAMLWPRRRRVLDELGVRRRSTGVHWLVLAVAFLVVPYGTVTVRRPFHEPHAPRDDDARRVLRVAGYCAPNEPIPCALFEEALGLDQEACDEAVEQLFERRSLRDVEPFAVGHVLELAALAERVDIRCEDDLHAEIASLSCAVVSR